MAPVVDRDIDLRVIGRHRVYNRRIILTTDEDLNTIGFVLLACGIDIDPDDLAAQPKIRLPHLKRPAAHNPDFKNDGLPSAKTFEMALINIEVMRPFVKPLAGIV